MEYKFKVGDIVVPYKFKDEEGFIPDMLELIDRPNRIDGIDDTLFVNLNYKIGNFYWPEKALQLATPEEIKQFELDSSPHDEQAKHAIEQWASPVKKIAHIGADTPIEPLPQPVIPQELRAEPKRKTLGDFMLAVLTGLMSRNAVCLNDIDRYSAGIKYANKLSEAAFIVAKQAFELYEKEDKP